MKPKTDLPSIERLESLLDYDDCTGFLFWKDGVKAGTRKLGGLRAGCLMSDGYRQIKIDGNQLKEHRIAWAIYYKKWPSSIIDHINRERDDNRIENLRICIGSLNQQNVTKQSGRSSRFLGVSKRKRTGMWDASIKSDRRSYFLGSFSSEEEAALAYAVAKLNFHNC